MLTKQRKELILAALRRDGHVVAKEMSTQMSLSEDTIRRDLRELASEGLLQRVHGGALPASQAVVDFAGRQALVPDEKRAIGRAAARLVQAGQVVFIDGGTTAVQLARSLDPRLRATVVTHSPSVALELVGHPGVEVVLIGGRLFKHSLVSVGAAAVEAVSRIHADLFFMGATGIHPKAGLTTGDMEEAHVKRAIMSAAGETVVLASSEKQCMESPYVIAQACEATTLIVPAGTPKRTLAPFQRAGLHIIQAEPQA